MSTTARLSLEQYDRMIDRGVFDQKDRQRIELIRGELREMSPIGPSHEEAVDLLTRWSVKSVPEESVRVRIQTSIGLPGLDSVPEPDLAWVPERDYSSGRPTAADVLLIIEVSDSSLQFDRGEKADLYAEAGIRDYWIVNLPERCVEVLREPQSGRYRSLQTAFAGQQIQPLSVPAVSLDVAMLFSAT